MILRKRAITSLDILTVLIAGIYLLDVPYLNHLINLRIYKMGLFAVLLFFEVAYFLRHKVRIRREHLALLFSAAYVILITLFNDGSLSTCISDFSTIICVCFLIVICRRKQDLIKVFSVWCTVFFVLMLIDTFTMIMWPNGLYQGTYIRNNWFLGYKTARLTYTFSLLLFYTYSELLEKRNLSIVSYILAILVSINAFMSNGNGAALAVIGYTVVMFLLFGKKKRYLGKVLQMFTQRIINNYVLLFVIWILVYLLVVALYHTPAMQAIIGMIGKDYSFSERTIAWSTVLNIIRQHWLFGIGVLNRNSTIQLTGGFANAHNTVFTYLLNGGVIGLSIIIYVIISAFRRTSLHPANYAVTVYIYCFMILGITSSAMALNPFFFAALLLPLKSTLDY